MPEENLRANHVSPTPSLIRFGPYELDLRSAELRKSNLKIRLQEQPFQVLVALLERPGEVVLREEIRQKLWPGRTVVEFDHGINAAVKRLRDALCESAGTPRYIETLARRGYRFIAPIEVALPRKPVAVLPPSPASALQARPSIPVPRPFGFKIVIAAVLATALSLLLLFALRSLHKSEPGRTMLVQLTRDTGLTMDPAVSPDGKLLAYVSDRPGGRNLNLWIQQLTPAGTAIQLTHFEAETRQPSFSPDGFRIVFSSAERGGGIYTIPAIGGEPTRVGPNGRSPHFSPDGQWISYMTGVQNQTVITGGEGGEIFLIPANGGPPRRLGSDVAYAGNPIWRPDSKSLLLSSDGDTSPSWYLAFLNGTRSSQTHVFDSLRAQGFSIGPDRVPRVSQWTPGWILFSATAGDSLNVWRMPVSLEGRSLGSAERLTSGTTLDASPLIAPNGDLIFASLNLVQSIWSLPIDADSARITGELKTLTSGAADTQPSISRDGRKLAFVVNQNERPDAQLVVSRQPSTFQARVKDLLTGKETAISGIKHEHLHAQISHDGTPVAHGAGNSLLQISTLGNSPPLTINATNNGGKVWDWSPDNGRVLFGKYPAPGIFVLERSNGRDSLFLNRTDMDLFQAKYSPDGQALALVGCYLPGESIGCRLFVVPLKADGTAGKENWIPVDHPSAWDDKPRWSPHGKLLYFISNRDGQFCLWAQRLDALTKRLIGTPFPVRHFHNSRLDMNNVGTSYLEIDVARDKIVMGLGELTGNIWTVKHASRQ